MRSMLMLQAKIAMLMLAVLFGGVGSQGAELLRTVPTTTWTLEEMNEMISGRHQTHLDAIKSGQKSGTGAARARTFQAFQEARAAIISLQKEGDQEKHGLFRPMEEQATTPPPKWTKSKSPGGIVDLEKEGTYYLFKSGEPKNFGGADQAFITQGNNSVTTNVAFDLPILATATYNPSLHSTGWDYLDIEASKDLAASSNYEDEQTAAWYYVGAIEGAVTADRIWANYLITTERFASEKANKAAREFILNQITYILLQAYFGYEDSPSTSPTIPRFNSTLGLIGTQLMGLTDGYNFYAESVGGNKIDLYEMFYLNYQPEIGDVDTWLTEKARKGAKNGGKMDADAPKTLTADFAGVQHLPKPKSFGQHCSALIKPTIDDLFMSHDTWSNFNSMLRQYKTYHFAMPETQGGGKPLTLSMSSYPGNLVSMDDWYLTSNGLTVQETTNGLYNNSLYEHFSSSTIPEWMRVMIANYVAVDGKQWTDYFVHLNSGSYNNQWMVVDMKLYKPQSNQKLQPGEKFNANNSTFLPDGLLWVSETLPGYAMSADVTYKLRAQGYWASYNIPFFPEIYALSGNKLMEELYGSFFSNVSYSRPEIFARDQPNITDLAGMKNMMRYNNFKHDKFSLIPNCTSATNKVCSTPYSAMLTIASRGDLDPAVTVADAVPKLGILASLKDPAWGYVGLQNLGAIDTKIASWKMMRNGKMEGVVISGPTSVQQPIFDYNTVPASIAAHTRYFVPEKWDFGWMSYTPTRRRSNFYGCYIVDGPNTFDANSPFAIAEGPIPEWTRTSEVGAPTIRNFVASALYNTTLEVTGWDQLTIKSEGQWGDGNGRVAAGYLEGYLTADRMWDWYVMNVHPYTSTFPGTGQESWIKAHIDFMQKLANTSYAGPNTKTVDWKELRTKAPKGFVKQLGFIWEQLKGVQMGYNRAMRSSPSKQLTLYDIFAISFNSEFGDVSIGVNATNWTGHASGSYTPPPPLAPPTASSKSHCSALIKPTMDDLFMSHTTWSNFNSMIRQYKTYDFSGAAKVSFSSYPGNLVSMDDWYISSNDMSIQETTNLIYNNELYKAFSPDTVSAWIRTMISNYQANSGAEWTESFSYLNSGSYNNQWMVVDYKEYVKGTTPGNFKPGVLNVIETLPGMFKKADVTHVLNAQLYWASYNVPYFPEIYKASGNLEMKETYGSYFSYTEYVRPRQFKRGQGAVKDIEGMKVLMRYNDFKHDESSLIPNCTAATNGTCTPAYSAMLAIASRGDLDPIGEVKEMGILASNVHPALGFVGQQNLGQLDGKIASYKQMKAFQGTVISGPTHDTQPVFDYGTVPTMIANQPGGLAGLPQRFDFSWVEMTSEMSEPTRKQVVVPKNADASTTGSSGSGTNLNHDTNEGTGFRFHVSFVIAPICGVLLIVVVIVLMRSRRNRRKMQAQGLYSSNQYAQYEQVGRPIVQHQGGNPIQEVEGVPTKGYSNYGGTQV